MFSSDVAEFAELKDKKVRAEKKVGFSGFNPLELFDEREESEQLYETEDQILENIDIKIAKLMDIKESTDAGDTETKPGNEFKGITKEEKKDMFSVKEEKKADMFFVDDLFEDSEKEVNLGDKGRDVIADIFGKEQDKQKPVKEKTLKDVEKVTEAPIRLDKVDNLQTKLEKIAEGHREVEKVIKKPTEVNKVKKEHMEVNKVTKEHMEVEKVIKEHTEVQKVIKEHTEVEKVTKEHTEVDKFTKEHTEVAKPIEEHTELTKSKKNDEDGDKDK